MEEALARGLTSRAGVEAIQRELTVDGLVLRYRTRRSLDGLPPGEGVFLACSFWLADALCMLGRWREARALFERLCRLANDVGLLAEEYDPGGGRQLGVAIKYLREPGRAEPHAPALGEHSEAIAAALGYDAAAIASLKAKGVLGAYQAEG